MRSLTCLGLVSVILAGMATSNPIPVPRFEVAEPPVLRSAAVIADPPVLNARVVKADPSTTSGRVVKADPPVLNA